MEINITV